MNQHPSAPPAGGFEDLYRELVELEESEAIFIADPTGRCLFVNRSACTLLGYAPDELLHMSLMDVFPQEELGASLAHLPASGALFRERNLTRRDGARVDVELRARKLRDGRVVVFVRDIGPRVAAGQALRDSEARYRSVVEAMTDGIVVHGSDGAIVSANAAAERVLGLTADQIAGRTSLDPRWGAIREDGSPFPGEEHPGYVTVTTGEPRTGVMMGVRKPTGELAWISINSRRITPIGETGAYSAVASFTDVTAQRHADARLHASLLEKDALLKEIHHRVKNNLQIISSLLYLQSTRTVDARVATVLRESQHRVASMALLHQQLYQAPNLSQIPFAIYAHDLARSLYDSYGASFDRIRLQISAAEVLLSVDAAAPCGLILNELLSNSLKHAYAEDARGMICVSVELDLEADRYRLRVSDDGVGLPADFGTRTKTSLGTKLVERLVAQVGGHLVRTSSPSGTRYEITFPREA